MAFLITETEIVVAGFRHPAMVVTPPSPMVVDRKRLAAVRGSESVNDVEKRILRECEQRKGRCHVAIFRGITTAGHVGWSFDPSFDERELGEAGYVMTRALLPLHRRMLANEILLFVHSEWGDRECLAMRKGVELAIEEAAARQDADSPLVRADLWILKNMLFHFALPMDRILESVLPPHLRMMHTRLPRVRTLVGELPKASIAY
jgi:hypothetical protein